MRTHQHECPANLLRCRPAAPAGFGCLAWFYFAVGLLCFPLLAPAAADRLEWQPGSNLVDADVDGWPLPRLLEEITSLTGWQIYLEPGSSRTISARFREKPASDALAVLLGELNFVLLPQSNAPSKLFVFRTTAEGATELVKASAKKNPIKHLVNELNVTLKPGASMDDLAKQLGAKVKGKIDGLNAYRLQFADEAAAKAARAKLDAHESVASIDFNFNIDRPVSAVPASSSSSLPFDISPTASTDSSRIIVALIDTAVQTLDPKYAVFLLPELSVGEKPANPGTTPLHGTSMVQTILRGVDMATLDEGASPVRILPVNVYGDSGITTTFEVAWGISKAIEAGAIIINLSLGSDGPSQILHTVISNGKEQGIIFFAAAGNTPTTAATYPAYYPEVTAVTAGSSGGKIASWANTGSFVDVVGPGTSLVKFGDRTFSVSGTSSSSAFMSGMAAGTMVTTGKSAAEAEARLRKAFPFKTTP